MTHAGCEYIRRGFCNERCQQDHQPVRECCPVSVASTGLNLTNEYIEDMSLHPVLGLTMEVASPHRRFDQSPPQVTQEDLNAGVWTIISDSGQGVSTTSYTASVNGTDVNGEPVSDSFRWTENLATNATLAMG